MVFGGSGDFDGLLLEPIAEFVIDFADDFFASFGEVGVGSGGFVDEDEGGFVTDAHAVKELTFEAGLFDKPTRVDFVAIFAVMDWVAFVGGAFGFWFGEVNVFEERAGAGFVAGVGEFVGANLTDNIADTLRSEIGELMVGNIAFDRIIKGARHLAFLKLEGNSDDEIASLFDGIEDTMAIGETKLVFH